jgi:ABC-type Fe3+-hydroxamate transport system substrate-binding protein
MGSSKWVLFTMAFVAVAGCQDYKYAKLPPKDSAQVHAAVSLCPSTTELAQVYLSIPVVGRAQSDDHPSSVANIQVVMDGVHPNVEAILQTGADGVLYDPALIGKADLDKLSQHHLVLIPIGGNSLESFEKSLYQAADLARAQTNTEDYIDNQITANLQAAAVKNSPTVALLMAGQGSEHMIDGTDSFQADILKKIGAKPVGPDAKMFVPLNVEELTKDNPDVILVAGAPDPIANDPRLAGLKAVKSKHVYGLKPDIALREGGHIPDLIKGMGEAIVDSQK